MPTPKPKTPTFPPTGRWEVRSRWDSNYENLVPVVVDPEGREDGAYEPGARCHAEVDAAYANARLDGIEGCPYCGPDIGCPVCGRLPHEPW